MPSDRERAISIGTAFNARLWSLTMAMLDSLDGPDDEPSAQYDQSSWLGHFSTYTEARRTFARVLTEEFTPRLFTHQMIVLDYSSVLQWDVTRDMSSLRSCDDESCASDGYAAAVLTRWGSWCAVHHRWPYRVPDDPAAPSKEQVEQVCCEIWTVIRSVGMTALVLGEGKPGDEAFHLTPDGYGAHGGLGTAPGVSWGLQRLIPGWLGLGVGAGKRIKQD